MAKQKSVVSMLSETLGGTWKCNPLQRVWWCDDDKRMIRASYSHSIGITGEYEDSFFIGYYLYGDGEPRRAEQYMYANQPKAEIGLDTLFQI